MTYTLPCVKQRASGNAVWNRELGSVLCDDLEGKMAGARGAGDGGGSRRRGYMYTHN